MLRTLPVLLALGFCMALPVSAQPAPSARIGETAQLAAWKQLVADFEKHERRESPLGAGREGDRDALRRLPDITPAGDARRLAAMQEFAARIAAVNPRALSPEDAFNHAFLERVVAESIYRARFDGARFAFNAEGGPGSMFDYLGRQTRISSAADAEAWIQRLQAIPGYYGAAIDNARRGMATQFTQPRSTVESAAQIARAEAAMESSDDPLLLPFASLPAGIPDSEQERLRAAAARLVAEEVVPARERWLRFLESEYLPSARPQLGLGSLENGQEYYAFLARAYTTTSMSPAEIHAVGAAEVRRIRAAMDAQVTATGFQGSFSEFLKWLRTDKRFYAQSREELLEKAAEMAKRADDGLPALFKDSLPRLPYGVRPVPREIEDQYTTGRYASGSMALGIAGGYLVNTGKLDQRPLYELPALTLHEAVPGHHLQVAISQELAEQPWFRRNANATSYVEGWGLYAEFLGEEMGIYRDGFERFGRLSYEMWRACRLVADTGIHAMGWSIEQARACFRDNSALSTHNIETELQRYISWPGQALAYKIGELRMKAMRERASAALGADFDIRAFHDTLLLGGPMPLELLDARVDAWIRQQQSN